MKLPVIENHNSYLKAAVDAGGIYKIKEKERENRNAKLLLALGIVMIISFAVYGVISLVRDVRKKSEPIGIDTEMKSESIIIASFKEIKEEVVASWYDYDLEAKDQKCRDESCYSKSNLTAASRDYPRGSKIEVCYQEKCVIIRINDYGPEERTGRDIDLSSYAFSRLADLRKGILKVKVVKQN